MHSAPSNFLIIFYGHGAKTLPSIFGHFIYFFSTAEFAFALTDHILSTPALPLLKGWVLESRASISDFSELCAI